MKKVLMIGLAILSLPSIAQTGLNTMQGNVSAFADNPGANTGLGYYITLPQVTSNIEMSQTLPSLWGDVAYNISQMVASSLDLHGQFDTELMGMGATIGKHKIWFSSGIQLDALAQLDKDLLVFANRGMLDDQGTIDPNYSGDFSENEFGIYTGSYVSMGWQAEINPKLRVGVAYRSQATLLAVRAHTTDFRFQSTDLGNNMNAIEIDFDGGVGVYSSAFVFNTDSAFGPMMDEWAVWAQDERNIIDAIQSANHQSSWDLGLTYDLNPQFAVTASYLGIGRNIDLSEVGVGVQAHMDLDYDGFNYDLGDSTTHPQFYFDNLLSYMQDSVAGSQDAPSWVISPYRGSHFGVVWQPSLSHVFSVDLWERVRTFQRTHTIGLNYQYQPTRGLQCAVGYRQPITYSDGRMPSISARIQARVAPLTYVHMSMASINMIAEPTDWNDLSEPWIVTNHMNRINFRAGVTIMLWDQQTKQAYRSRKDSSDETEQVSRREAKRKSRKL